MQFGVGAALIPARKPAIKAMANPLDKTTIVSIYPKTFTERKVTIEPGVFTVEAGSFDKPSLLVIGTSSWWRELDLEMPLLEIPQSSIQIADSIIRDWANGLYMCDMGGSMPGLFYIPGEIGLIEVKTKYRKKLEEAKEKQDKWYHNLIQAGDVLWARSNGNPLSISDDMRLAAEQLGLKDRKAWMGDFVTIEMKNCPACGTLIKPGFPICANCHHVIDHEAYKQLGLVKAGA